MSLKYCLERKVMFLNSFNHFRAIAILFIVFGHTYGLGGLVPDSLLEKTIQNFITGGTALFVFISGFLFHHIFYKRYTFRSFMKGKIKNVLIPYLLLSILPVAYYVSMNSGNYNGFFLPNGIGLFDEYIIPTLKYYWTGRALVAYWYIPFIIVTFMMSPLHMKFITLNVRYQLFIVLVTSIVAMLIQRPISNLYVFQSVVYFLPVYLIGIMASIHRDIIYRKLDNKVWLLLVGVLSLAFLQAAFGKVGNWHKLPFELHYIDLMFLQKLFLCFFFMVWLRRFENFQNSWVHRLASTSFAIFFIHPYLVRISEAVAGRYDLWPSESWILYIVISLIIITISMAIAIGLRKLLPSYSRFITGY